MGRLRDLAKSIAVIEEPVVTARCVRYTDDVRSVSRRENEAGLDRMAERLKTRPEILDRRCEAVEHPFSSILGVADLTAAAIA